MDAGLIWTALGTAVSGLALGVAWRQLRVQARLGRGQPNDPPAPAAFGVSVRPPTGQLPAMVRGRDQVLRLLARMARRPPGECVVLTGTGGVGKSTIAAALAERAQRTRIRGRRPHVWWVSAADAASLTAAMTTVARQLGAHRADVEAIGADAMDAPDRLWTLLERSHRRWLLIIDNADDPHLLARRVRHPVADPGAPISIGTGSVGDGTGWIRRSGQGLVVITSRNASRDMWGRRAHVLTVSPLDEADAARVLLDWAPEAGDETQALTLARRLGSLPLALRVAGSYLESDVALRTSFSDYRHALDDRDHGRRLLAGEPATDTDARAVVMLTWEITLDNLARHGIPQARGLLRLLSCYAATTPIPLDLLDSERLTPLLTAAGADTPTPTSADAEQSLEQALRHLRQHGLIDTRSLSATGSHERALIVHPLIADTNRYHLFGDLTSDVDAALVRRIAAGLMVAALDRLRCDRPADWPRYRLLGPHLHALFETVAAHLDRQHLAVLIRATAIAARAHDWSGAVPAGERLSRATLNALPLLDHDDPASLLARHELAWEVAIQGRWVEAEATYRSVLAGRRRILGEEHPDTLASRHELAWVAGAQGRWAEAETAYREVLDARRRVLGDEHPDTLTTHHELAWAIANQGRADEAEPTLEHIIDNRRRVLGNDHPQTLTSRHELAWAIATQGRWAEAEAAYHEVLDARRRVLGDEHPDTLTTRHERAWTIAMQGKVRAATKEYQSVFDARRRVLGDDHHDTIATQQSLERLGHGQTTPAYHPA